MTLEITELPQLVELPPEAFKEFFQSAKEATEQGQEKRKEETQKEQSKLGDIEEYGVLLQNLTELTNKISDATKSHTKKSKDLTDKVKASANKSAGRKYFEREAAVNILGLANAIQELVDEMSLKTNELKNLLPSVLYFIDFSPPGIEKLVVSSNNAVKSANILLDGNAEMQKAALDMARIADTPSLRRASKNLVKAIENYNIVIKDIRDSVFKPIANRHVITIIFVDPSQETLTPHYLASELAPYLKALEQLQNKFNELMGYDSQPIIIRKIEQNSPISVSIEGLGEVITAIQNIFDAEGRKLNHELTKANVLETRARASKERSEIERIKAEASILLSDNSPEMKKLKLEQLEIENDKSKLELMEQRLELMRKYLDLAIEFVEKCDPNLSNAEKKQQAIDILPSIIQLNQSRLEIQTVKEGIDT